MLITLHLLVLCGSQNKQEPFALYCLNWMVFITEVESVYSAVRIESLYNTDTIRLRRVNIILPSTSFSPQWPLPLRFPTKNLRTYNNNNNTIVAAAQEQAINTIYCKCKILKEETESECRLWKEEEEEATAGHVISGCPILVKNEYWMRQDKICEYLN